MNVALIGVDGVIVNTISADSVERAQEFYPDLLCLECPEQGCSPGDSYADGVWTPFVPPTVADVPAFTSAAVSLVNYMAQAGLITAGDAQRILS